MSILIAQLVNCRCECHTCAICERLIIKIGNEKTEPTHNETRTRIAQRSDTSRVFPFRLKTRGA